MGVCWETEAIQPSSWRSINDRYARNLPREEAWLKLPPETTRGFTYKEWGQMLGRYLEVIAVPIVSDAKVIGVLAVDLRGTEAEYQAVEIGRAHV